MYYTNRRGNSNYAPNNSCIFDARIMEWFSNTKFEVMHIESQGHSATYTVWLPDSNWLIIARVFTIGDKVEISIDKEFEFFA